MMRKAVHIAHNVMHPVYYGSVAIWGSVPYNYAAGGLCLLTLWLAFSAVYPEHGEEFDNDLEG